MAYIRKIKTASGVFVWAAYWFLNRVWLGGGFVQKAAILFVGGFIGTLGVLLVGDLIRMLLYQFNKGDQIVDFALFGTKTKWEPVVDLPPEGRVNGTIKHKLSFHKTSVLQLNFIQNGQVLVSSTADGETSLWNVADGQQIVAAQTPYALSSDGTILAYLGEEGRIKITKIGDSEPTVTLQLPNQKISHRMGKC